MVHYDLLMYVALNTFPTYIVFDNVTKVVIVKQNLLCAIIFCTLLSKINAYAPNTAIPNNIAGPFYMQFLLAGIIRTYSILPAAFIF